MRTRPPNPKGGRPRAPLRKSRTRTAVQKKKLLQKRKFLQRAAGPDRAVNQARRALSKFRQGSALTIAITSLLFLILGTPADGASEETKDNVSAESTPQPQSASEEDISTTTYNEASGFFQSLAEQLSNFFPKILIALLILFIGWILNRLIKTVLRTTLRSWSRAEATSALVGVAIFFFSIGTALSALAGDVRALLGSVGLVGLALSWALQTPIESFTGWLLNSFRGYYAVGDRIEVGEVFGDVFRIDILTTTVWQAGGPGSSVQAAQPTGALITFPNSEVLRANIINYTRDFPYVWDEIAIGVSNNTDLRYAMEVIQKVAFKVFGESMQEPAKRYQALLNERHMNYEVQEHPSVFAFPTDSWTQIVVRYLVKARERRKWSTVLYVAITEELIRPEHQGRIYSGYPRSQVELYYQGPKEVTPSKSETM